MIFKSFLSFPFCFSLHVLYCYDCGNDKLVAKHQTQTIFPSCHCTDVDVVSRALGQKVAQCSPNSNKIAVALFLWHYLWLRKIPLLGVNMAYSTIMPLYVRCWLVRNRDFPVNEATRNEKTSKSSYFIVFYAPKWGCLFCFSSQCHHVL